MNDTNKRITLRLSQEALEALEAVKLRTGESINQLIIDAIITCYGFRPGVIDTENTQAETIRALQTEIAELKSRVLSIEAFQLGTTVDITVDTIGDTARFTSTNNDTIKDTNTMQKKPNNPTYPDTATTEELLEILGCLPIDLKEIAAMPIEKQCRALSFIDPSTIGYKTEDGKIWHRCHPDEAMLSTDKRLFGKPLREYLKENNGKVDI